ncbi:hypothetical protein QL093DRAFT_2388028 [Fusarium oxysporum]|nr:hypothetical protein QL093DRAFT_2388028 [Fusarium oxysporum]
MSAWPQPSFQISTHIKYLPGSIINVSSYIYIQFLDYTPAEQSFRSFSCTVYLCLGPRLSQVSGVWRVTQIQDIVSLSCAFLLKI